MSSSAPETTRLYALAKPDDAKLDVIVVYNPLDLTDRTVTELEWQNGKSLSHYADGLPEFVEWAIAINGEPVDRDKWEVFYPQPNDSMVVMPVIRGGGGGGNGKMIMRLVAMIAIAVVAWYAAPLIAGAMGLTGTALTVGTAVIGGVISVVGSMVVNALLPAARPKANNNGLGSASPDTLVYGIDGPKNTATEDIAVPLVFGTYRMAGNLVDVRVDNVVQSDGTQTQELYMRSVISEGEIDSIDTSSLLVEQQKKAYFQNVDVDYRLGTDNQSISPWFNRVVREVNRSWHLDTTWQTYTTETPVEGLRLDFVFPNGLYSIDGSTGARENASVSYDIQYSPTGQNLWSSFPAVASVGSWWSVVSATLNGGGQNYAVGDTITLAGGTYDEPAVVMVDSVDGMGAVTGFHLLTGGIYSAQSAGTIGQASTTGKGSGATFNVSYGQTVEPASNATPNTITAAQRTALRFSHESGPLPLGVYDVRVHRINAESTVDTVADQLYLADIDEINNEPCAYNFTAWYAIHVTLSNILDHEPTTTIMVNGIKCHQYDSKGNLLEYAWTNNPAWITLEMMTNTRWGGGITLDRVDMEKFYEWSQFCATNGYVFNGVFDTTSNIWDCCQAVLRVGHANFVNIGTTYSLVIDQPDTPVQMFSVANMVKGSFQIEWVQLSDRANEIEITYYDANDYYRQHTVRAYDLDSVARGDPQRLASITLLGVTDNARAYEEAVYQINMNKYILQGVTFDVPVEALACTVGDLIYVTHDMPDWGDSGRLVVGSTASNLILDRDVTMDSAVSTDYRILVVHSSVERVTSITVNAIIGKSIFVSSSFPSQVKRVKFGSTFDAGIVEIIPNTPFTEIVLDQDPAAAGITIGSGVAMWDTDVIDEVPVVFAQGTTNVITPQTPLEVAPDDYAQFMFGANTKIKKIFRVRSVKHTSDMVRTINAFEYNASIYNPSGLAAPIPNYSALPVSIGQVQNPQAYEELFYSGNAARVNVYLDWTVPYQGVYAGANVYVSVNGGAMTALPAVRGSATSTAYEANTGDQLVFKIVAVDGAGGVANPAQAPTLTYTVQGLNKPPADVQNFQVEETPAGIEFDWSPNPEPTVIGYEIREGSDWTNGTVLISKFAGTRFITHKNKAGTYTWWIKAINNAGVKSTNAVSVTLNLPAPAAVTGFQAVQSDNLVILDWNPNTEPDIFAYEIREGANWVSSIYLNQITSTRWSFPNTVAGNRTFWIKAIDNAGIYSDTGVFAELTVNQPQDRNVILTVDKAAASFPDFKYNTQNVPGTGLELDANVVYGEYVGGLDAGAVVTARVTVNDSLTAIDAAQDTSWANASFSWGSTQASRSWVIAGDLESVIMTRQVSTFSGLEAGAVEEFTFNDTLNGVGGTAPTTVNGTPTYQPGRFSDGVLITDTDGLVYDVSIPAQFSISFAARPQLVDALVQLMEFDAAGGVYLKLYFDPVANVFRLTGSDGIDVTAANFGVNVGDRLLIGISQGATLRHLWVGRQDDGTSTSGVATAAPLGAFTSLTM